MATNAIPGVKKVILVSSGKGGVGKSMVATNLALALSKNKRVGLLDADIYGPSIPKMLNLERQEPELVDEYIVNGEVKKRRIPLLKPLKNYGIKALSIGNLIEEDSATIWRGPLLQKALHQLLFQVQWADSSSPLDYLVVDMPPGTGDVQLTIAQRVSVAGALIVTTPQQLALIDVKRAMDMYKKMNIPILGVVENMSYFICDSCDKKHYPFVIAGAQSEIERLGESFLTSLPINPLMGQCADEGKPFLILEDEPGVQEFHHLAHVISSKV
eukprot:CAMPEP_0117431380 /NCGR_PEP_ID=MMETSP0758-20121206/10900_1 /TAXON_ID=63605 /ORGANISM="Percolomonas cosmopolitus, Strain AE-1 (ATCC 50343)" /LENGTH=270 /DNA_ID=CAMNT_0005220303 /DNA_START=143 /DNA_END=955 /DNA_ORIENTATION=-